MKSDKHRLLAFHEKELMVVLEKLGLLEKMKNGKLKCAICGRVITKENLGAILKKKNDFQIICDDLKCLEKCGAGD